MIDIEHAISPYNLLQEQQVGKPYGVWRILVVCQLLNRTHGRVVRPMIDDFFQRWPSPNALSHAIPDQLNAAIRPLGFGDQRYRNLKQMSVQYAALLHAAPDFWRSHENADWCLSLFGCGKYARDSLNLVVYGVLDLPTSDHWLVKYHAWRVERRALRERGLL